MPRPSDRDDRTLLVQASSGDDLAFAELYLRHADAAWRAAYGILSNADDAADAVADAFTRLLRMVRERTPEIEHVRAYVLTATRNAALDRCRSREEAWDFNSGTFDGRFPEAPSASETVIDLTDETFALTAFRQLPDRWREVLWLTEVEGLRPADIAERLGMTANAVAQLAFRARAGLRERYIDAHLPPVPDHACGSIADRLAAMLSRSLSDREQERIDRHLAECERCRDREEELRLAVP